LIKFNIALNITWKFKLNAWGILDSTFHIPKFKLNAWGILDSTFLRHSSLHKETRLVLTRWIKMTIFFLIQPHPQHSLKILTWYPYPSLDIVRTILITLIHIDSFDLVQHPCQYSHDFLLFVATEVLKLYLFNNQNAYTWSVVDCPLTFY